MKAAVVGLGWWGKQIISYLKSSEKIQVTHGVDLQIAHLDDFAKVSYSKEIGNPVNYYNTDT